MILLDQEAGTTRTLPDAEQSTRRGKATVIILERDGSLHHYPPERPRAPRQAQIDLHEEQTQPNMIDRILTFTFDVLGINNLEVRVYEHPKS